MLPEQIDLIYKHFPELVQECDLEYVLKLLVNKQPLAEEILDKISFGDDKYHNNRCILFKILQFEKCNIFPDLIECLREAGSKHLANTLGNNETNPDNETNKHPLDVAINMRFSSRFYDTKMYNNTSFYSTRSKNRGQVLIINNINFPDEQSERQGAEFDEANLRVLFEEMGLIVISHTNLSAYDMYTKTLEFSKNTDQTNPDICIIIIMSHGTVVNNETVILSSDDQLIPEDSLKELFNNEKCALFKNRPKIFIYHICRNVLKKSETSETMTDARTASKRTYSDMLICHPSVKGYYAHRNVEKGSWYIQLLCKVFMNHAHEMDVESLLKKVDEELEIVSSLPWKMDRKNQNTEQTSTFQNIAFKRCYLHPGIYEEDGKLKHFSRSK